VALASRVPASVTGRLRLLHNPYQQAFLAALLQRLPDGRRAYQRLALFSGRRGGKTEIGAVGVGAEVATFPYSRWWVCAPTYPKLHDYVIPAMSRVLRPSWLAEPYSKSNREWKLKNGSIVQARSLDDIERGRGPGLDGAWIDEARETSKKAFDTITPAISDRGGTAIVTTSPNGFDWCYRVFWLNAQQGEPGFWACKYRTADNPAFPIRELELSRKTMDPLFFKQEYEAEFVSFTGAIYADTLPQQILDTDEQVKAIIPEWPRIHPTRETLIAVDPGADHPFAATLYVSTERGLVCIGEYLARNLATIQHSVNLRSMCAKDNPSMPWNPSRWGIDRSQKQMQIELAQHGIFTMPAENDVVAGIQRVQSWLVTRRLWFVRSRCPKTVEQMYSYRWAENTDPHGRSLKEKVIKEQDDLPDTVRSARMIWPELPGPEAPKPGRDLSAMPEKMQQDLQRMERIDHPERFEDESDVDTPGMLGEAEGGIGEFW